MKKCSKIIAMLIAVTMLLTTGISAYALDYDHIQSGYGAQGGTDLNSAVWSLNVSPYLSNSTGSLINGYTGSIFCGIVVDWNWYESTASNYNSLQQNGDGSWAEIYFYNVQPPIPPPTPITDSADEKTGAGVKSGSTSQISWYIEAATTFASSSGSVAAGYTGMVYCAVIANDIWYDSDAANSNSLNAYGSNTYAEVWIR